MPEKDWERLKKTSAGNPCENMSSLTLDIVRRRRR